MPEKSEASSAMQTVSNLKWMGILRIQAVFRRRLAVERLVPMCEDVLEESVKDKWNTMSQLSFAQNQSQMLDASFLEDYQDELLQKLQAACKRIWACEALLVSSGSEHRNPGVLARERQVAADKICSYAKSFAVRAAPVPLAPDLSDALAQTSCQITVGGRLASKEAEFAADLASLASEGFVSELRTANIVSLDSRDSSGNTALHFAAWRGHLLACHWLVSVSPALSLRQIIPFVHLC